MEPVTRATEQQEVSFEETTATINEMRGLVKSTAKEVMISSATSEEAIAVVDQITEGIHTINSVGTNVNGVMEWFTILVN